VNGAPHGLSELFPSFSNRSGSAILPEAMLDLFVQFALELVRALLVDELSERVRKNMTQWLIAHGARSYRRALLNVHRRNRVRLLNRLLTEIREDM
jgi:hypothetical protein